MVRWNNLAFLQDTTSCIFLNHDCSITICYESTVPGPNQSFPVSAPKPIPKAQYCRDEWIYHRLCFSNPILINNFISKYNPKSNPKADNFKIEILFKILEYQP